MKFTSTILALALASTASAALLNARQEIPTTLAVDPSVTDPAVSIPGTEDPSVSVTDTLITPSDTLPFPTDSNTESESNSFTVTLPTASVSTPSSSSTPTGLTVSVPIVTPPTTPGDGASTTRAGVLVAGAAVLIAFLA